MLEIGAGTGNLTAQLIPRTLYWATDINPLYLMYLENVGRNRPYMRVGFTDGEKQETYPQEQRFDTVICLNVVEHLSNDVGALLNIERRWRMEAARLFWCPVDRDCTERWTKFLDTIEDTRGRRWKKLLPRRAFA